MMVVMIAVFTQRNTAIFRYNDASFEDSFGCDSRFVILFPSLGNRVLAIEIPKFRKRIEKIKGLEMCTASDKEGLFRRLLPTYSCISSASRS